MDNKTGVFLEYNGETATLVYNDSIVLLHSVCTLIINGSQNYSLNNWQFKIIFEEEPDYLNNKPPLSYSVETDWNRRIMAIKLFKWYGEGLENPAPFSIAYENENKLLIKIKTTAFESKKERRKVEISIWSMRNK